MIDFSKIEKYAHENDVPIMQKDGIEFLCEFIKNNNIKNILEIGSAIGYSALKMASCHDDINIVTIERDQHRYNVAVDNIEKSNFNNQIKIILGDALETEIDGKYDLILIDAAKSQYIKFFNRYKSNLHDNGYIITDNLTFHGMIYDIDNINNRNTKQLVKKIKKFKDFLEENDEFNTDFINIGDGFAISKNK